MPMHDIFDSVKNKKIKMEKEKEKNKKKKELKCFYIIASVFSRRCESNMM